MNLPNTEVYDSTHSFYGINQASMNETIIICESLWDVITNRVVGVKNVIAAMGHEFTAYHAKTISQLSKKVCICYDTDSLGHKMAHNAIELLKYEGVECLLADLKLARDSAEYIRLFGKSEYFALLGKYEDKGKCMSIKEKEDKLFEELRKAVPEAVDDGVVSEVDYLSAEKKILFVLKEVNGGQGWSLRNFLLDGGRAQTWNNISRWATGILNLDKNFNWKDLEFVDEEYRKRSLRKIAAINLKKISGECVADDAEIYKAAKMNSRILREQLDLYNPDIVVCCGTAYGFVDFCYGGVNDWLMTSRGIRYIKDEENSRVIVEFSHPEARVNNAYLYYALTDAVKEIYNTK